MTESSQPDPERQRLSRSIFEPSPLEEVAEAVSVATEHETRVYVERVGDRWRWSLTHRAGFYPLLRIAARFLRVDYHHLVIGFRKVSDGVFVLCKDPAVPERCDTWSAMEFEEMIEPADVKERIARTFADDEVRLWLDDDMIDRAAPPGWTHVTTVREATDLLNTGRVVELSLDHDLGDDERFGRGVDVVDWLAEQQEVRGRLLWPRDGITIHSANPVGRDAMLRAIEHYAGRVIEVHRSLTPSGKPRVAFSQSESEQDR